MMVKVWPTLLSLLEKYSSVLAVLVPVVVVSVSHDIHRSIDGISLSPGAIMMVKSKLRLVVVVVVGS